MVFWNKINKIYRYSNAVLIALALAWYLIAPVAEIDATPLIYVMAGYAVISTVLRWLISEKMIGAENHTLVTIILDAVFIAAIVRYTGRFDSHFYLMFFPLTAFAGIIISKWRSLISSSVVAACHAASLYSADLDLSGWVLLAVRTAAILSVGFVSNISTYFMRSSEKKLLKTLDTLNERTWELESSQGQLSNIYETTRALSGILNPEHLLSEVLNVANNILRLQKCQIYLSNVTNDCVYLYASLENGNKRIFTRPTPIYRNIGPLNDLDNRTSIIKSINSGKRNKGQSTIEIPMISSGKVIGILQIGVESGQPPSEKELRLLMVFANSSAVAIDNSMLHKKTEELTIIDELTELFNFRYFKAKLVDEIRRADRYHQKLGLLMLDIDHFKSINDKYGHQTGNIVLKEISSIIKQCVRDVDIVSRYGGEEFMVILPQTEEVESSTIAERIRSTVESTYFSNSNGQREVLATISIGIASYADGVHTMEQLLESVDKALYAAKSTGRNKIKIAEKFQHKATEPLNIVEAPK